jgi:hypothetical protein
MKTNLQYLAFLILTVSCAHAADATTPAEKSFDAPHGMKMSVEMADTFDVQDLTFKAGPTFFAGAVAKLGDGIKISSQLTGRRQSIPYSTAKAP